MVVSQAQPHFELLAIINSDTLYVDVVSPMPKGQIGARDFPKHLWKMTFPEASLIRVNAVDEGFHVAVSVEDQGSGCPPRGCRSSFGSSPDQGRRPGKRHRPGPGDKQGDRRRPLGTDMGREQRAGPGGEVHLHGPGGGGGRTRGGDRTGEAGGRRSAYGKGTGAHPGGG